MAHTTRAMHGIVELCCYSVQCDTMMLYCANYECDRCDLLINNQTWIMQGACMALW